VASSSSSSTSSMYNDGSPLVCPVSVPAALWSELSRRYNPSQLRAIAAVCATTVQAMLALALGQQGQGQGQQGVSGRAAGLALATSSSSSSSSTSSSSSSSGGTSRTMLEDHFAPFSVPVLTLLQGPPGTGKVGRLQYTIPYCHTTIAKGPVVPSELKRRTL
jgi:hypothetical protein